MLKTMKTEEILGVDDEAFLTSLRQGLRELATRSTPSLKRVVAQLWAEIHDARENGATWRAIAAELTQRGFPIEAETLRIYHNSGDASGEFKPPKRAAKTAKPRNPPTGVQPPIPPPLPLSAHQPQHNGYAAGLTEATADGRPVLSRRLK
jgi:hypothetical protein